jgi:trimeric autotransporter adhesin
MRSLLLVLLAVTSLAVGCGGGGGTNDGAVDTASADRPSLPPDAAPDGATDAAVDAPPVADLAAPDRAPDQGAVDAAGADGMAGAAAESSPDLPPPDGEAVDSMPPDLAAPDAASPAPDGRSPADLPPGGEAFVAVLRGVEEVPQVTSPATGSLDLVLDPGQTSITYRLRHTVAGATGAALHLGSAGETGAAAIAITPLSGDASGGAPITSGQIAELEAGRFYVSVESTTFPAGEIRGQVLRPGEREFVGHLSGAQETPANASAGGGPANFIINAAGDSVRWRVATADVTFDNSFDNYCNVHLGPAGLVSHVTVFRLLPIGPLMTGQEPIDAAGLAGLARGLWSVHIHTTAYPNGEVRGHLIELGETLYSASFDGDSEIPPVDTWAEGGIGIILNAARTRIRYEGMVMSMVPTQADVRVAPPGMIGGVAFTLPLTDTTMSGERAVTADEIAAMDTGSWYVNVESANQPGGEIRGQLTRK